METKNRFAGILSDEYEMVKLMIPHYDEHEDTIRRALSRYAGSRSGRFEAMDIGCGTGFSTRRMLEADPRIYVIGIDNEPAMLRQAEVYCEKFAFRAEFRERDAIEALARLPDGYLSIVASACVLHNLPPEYRRSLMQQVGRVLHRDGLFVNADKLGLDDPAKHAHAFSEQLENLKIFDRIGRPDLREAWQAHYLEDEEINFSEAEQKALLREFGFGNICTTYRRRLEATVTGRKT